MPTIIVIGYREDLDRALRSRDLDPYYLIQEPTNPPRNRRFARVTDMEDAQEVLRAVLAAGIAEPAGALSVHEMGVFTAAFLRQQLRLPGNADPKGTLYFRDKCLQKSALPPDIRRARCRHVPPGTPFRELADELGEPFVVKPANGAGALRTGVVRTPEEYARALEPLSGASDVQAVAESHVAAPEIYLDGVWDGGALRWSSLTRYHASPLSAVQGGVLAAHLMDERRHPDLFREARALAERVLASLEAPDCVFHMEFFAVEQGLMFGECAIRLPGALSPQAAHSTFGIDLFDAEISLALGEKPHVPLGDRPPERFHGYVLLRRPRQGELTQGDFERHFPFDMIEYSASPEVPAGPYGSVGRALVSERDEWKLRELIADIVRFNETGGAGKAWLPESAESPA
ncbi:hypothetical protein GCM10009801_64270 [Streptomyces albiaxialis]|uniref:ATP-grasp domain-containing protein n=1 Tax=Streptomyces albiaxialis TaxID=329523 RepID=A0ABN2WMG6_9ACTN